MARKWLPSLRQQAKPPAEERALDPTSPPDWATFSGGAIYSAQFVTLNSAVGLPAVAKAIFTLCETVAQLPLNVYKGRGAAKRLAENSWQYRLLVELPGMGDFTPFDLLSDVVACLESNGNAYLQKVKAGGEVVALIVVDPSRVRVRRENGEKQFLVREDGGKEQVYDAGTILHIRGLTLNGSDVGISPIALHRQKIGSIQAQDHYQARYYGQGTKTDTVIQLPPGKVLKTGQAEELKRRVTAQNSGVENVHLPLVLQDGATIARSGFSLEDSQFIEGTRMNLLEAAHIFRIPPRFLTGDGDLTEWDVLSLYTFAVAPRLRRIELAFWTDRDMFPDRKLYPEFDPRKLVRTDAKTMAEVEHMQIQDGSKLPDEARADRGEPPLPPIPDDPTATPGMVPQLTPVGGAPNPNTTPPAGG